MLKAQLFFSLYFSQLGLFQQGTLMQLIFSTVICYATGVFRPYWYNSIDNLYFSDPCGSFIVVMHIVLVSDSSKTDFRRVI